MNNIDDVSRAIGQLEAKMDIVILAIETYKAELAKITQIVLEDKEELARIKNRGMGLILGITLASASLGAFLKMAVTWVLGK